MRDNTLLPFSYNVATYYKAGHFQGGSLSPPKPEPALYSARQKAKSIPRDSDSLVGNMGHFSVL